MSERQIGFYFATTAGAPHGNLGYMRVAIDLNEHLHAVMRLEIPTVPLSQQPKERMVFDADDLQEFGEQCIGFAESMRKAAEQSEIAEEEPGEEE